MARRYMRDKNEAVYSFYSGIESNVKAQSSRWSSSAVLMMMDEKRDSGWVSLEGFLQPTLAAACGSAFVRMRSGAEAPLMCSQRRTPTSTAAGPPLQCLSQRLCSTQARFWTQPPGSVGGVTGCHQRGAEAWQ